MPWNNNRKQNQLKNRFKVLSVSKTYDRFWHPCFQKMKTLKEKQDYAIQLMIGPNHQEIQPVFYREGRYFDRLNKMVWIEKFGRAFEPFNPYDSVEKNKKKNIEYFNHDLEFRGNNRIRDDHYHALLELSNYQKLPKELDKIVYIESLHRQCRAVYVNAKKSSNRILKKIKEIKNEQNRT